MDFSRPFFSGIAGTGMSALAQYLAFQGFKVSGSDRSLDLGNEVIKKKYFEKIGIKLCVQDGSGVEGCSALIVSTAIENQNPEVKVAKNLGIPIIHRSDLLAELARLKNTIAISGTSGKSTVTGMTYHVLAAGGLNPSLITGANLVSLQAESMLGNAKVGTVGVAGMNSVGAAKSGNAAQPGDAPEWLVIEADESDGSLVKYSPEVGVILNVEKDHKEISELIPLFKQFRDQTVGTVILNGSDLNCLSLKRKDDLLFYPDTINDGAVENLQLSDWETEFTLAGIAFQINVPGKHNLTNALAAITIGRVLGISLTNCAKGIAEYQGVERRHCLIGHCGPSGLSGRGGLGGKANTITVVDDFAHNPAKVKACLETVKASHSGIKHRVLAIFHPHGFAPMKLLGQEIIEAMIEVLDNADIVYMPEIYYAGGTADKTISSADLIAKINSSTEKNKPQGKFFATKDQVIEAIVQDVKPGDWVVSMGARDPSLGEFAEKLFVALKKSAT